MGCGDLLTTEGRATRGSQAKLPVHGVLIGLMASRSFQALRGRAFNLGLVIVLRIAAFAVPSIGDVPWLAEHTALFKRLLSPLLRLHPKFSLCVTPHPIIPELFPVMAVRSFGSKKARPNLNDASGRLDTWPPEPGRRGPDATPAVLQLAAPRRPVEPKQKGHADRLCRVPDPGLPMLAIPKRSCPHLPQLF